MAKKSLGFGADVQRTSQSKENFLTLPGPSPRSQKPQNRFGSADQLTCPSKVATACRAAQGSAVSSQFLWLRSVSASFSSAPVSVKAPRRNGRL